jgi:hypothetical protein
MLRGSPALWACLLVAAGVTDGYTLDQLNIIAAMAQKDVLQGKQDPHASPEMKKKLNAVFTITPDKMERPMMDDVAGADPKARERCVKAALKNNKFTRAVQTWQHKAKQRGLTALERKIFKDVEFRMMNTAASSRARDSLKLRCSRNFYWRAIYRHESRFLIARAIKEGYHMNTRSKRRLLMVDYNYKCERMLFSRVESLGANGNMLKHYTDTCKQMKESWTARLDVAAHSFATVLRASTRKNKKRRLMCNVRLYRGHLRRAKYMLEGIKVSCDHGRLEGKTGGGNNILKRAKLRHEIAKYAFNALSTRGREFYADSETWLRKDPVWIAAHRYMQNRKKEVDLLQGAAGWTPV